MVKVVFKDGDGATTVDLEREVSLLSAAAKGGVEVLHRCGGHARCGTCVCTVEEGAAHLTPMGASEKGVLEILGAKDGQRLCCQAWAQGDVTVRLR